MLDLTSLKLNHCFISNADLHLTSELPLFLTCLLESANSHADFAYVSFVVGRLV